MLAFLLIDSKLINYFTKMELQSTLEEINRIFPDKEEAKKALRDTNLIQLFGLQKATREIVTFVISCFPEKILLEYFVDLINFRDDNLCKIVVPKLPVENFSSKKWKILSDVVEEDDDHEFLKEYFKEKMANNKPWWVKKFSKRDWNPIPSELPTVHEAIQLLTEDVEKLALEERDQDKLISQYAISTVIEKIQMLSHCKEIPMYNDIPIFREFGPVNQMYSTTSIESSERICNLHGGCRMFLCCEFEETDEEDDEISDWFTGRCQVCEECVENKYYCLRMPLLHGGWKGCYCSFACLVEDIPDELTSLLVGRMKEQLETIGIRDRKMISDLS